MNKGDKIIFAVIITISILAGVCFLNIGKAFIEIREAENTLYCADYYLDKNIEVNDKKQLCNDEACIEYFDEKFVYYESLLLQCFEDDAQDKEGEQ